LLKQYVVLARQRHEPCVRYSGRHFTAGRNRNTAFVPNVHDEGGRLDLREEMSNVKSLRLQTSGSFAQLSTTR
jgi:hypothetical protein